MKILEKINGLQRMIHVGAVQAPVYVRFEAGHHHTVGVLTVSHNGAQVVIVTVDHGTLTLDLKDVTHVVAFNDAKGKPVFLGGL